MEKLLHIVRELNKLQPHHEDVIKTSENLSKRIEQLRDVNLAGTIASIREKSETSCYEIQEAIKNYYLKIDKVDAR